jgi:hypothetical protein
MFARGACAARHLRAPLAACDSGSVDAPRGVTCWRGPGRASGAACGRAADPGRSGGMRTGLGSFPCSPLPPAAQRGSRGSTPERTKSMAHLPLSPFPFPLGCAGALLSPAPAHRVRYPPRRHSVQAKPEKSERKVLAIPSIVEQVKAASPAKAEYGLDYYGNFAPATANAVLSGLCAGDAGASTLRIALRTFDAAIIAIGADTWQQHPFCIS